MWRPWYPAFPTPGGGTDRLRKLPEEGPPPAIPTVPGRARARHYCPVHLSPNSKTNANCSGPHCHDTAALGQDPATMTSPTTRVRERPCRARWMDDDLCTTHAPVLKIRFPRPATTLSRQQS